jgi:hypothetical protein
LLRRGFEPRFGEGRSLTTSDTRRPGEGSWTHGSSRRWRLVRQQPPEGLRRSEEVENPKGVGASPRSGSQVQSDRHPEVRRARGPGCFRASRYRGEQAHEGRAQAQRLSWNTSEGEKVRRASARGVPNRAFPSTDALPEQGSEVAGSCLARALRVAFREPTVLGICLCVDTATGSRPLAQSPARFGEQDRGSMSSSAGRCRAPGSGCRSASGRCARSIPLPGARGDSRVRSRVATSQPNGKRAEGAERRHGWQSGKSSEDHENPKGGCGAKQSHEARGGSNR